MIAPLVSRIATLLPVLLILVWPACAWSTNLPLTKTLTVRLSSISSQGLRQTVSEISARTDATGKIPFHFPVVPSAAVTPFLHIQIMDGDAVLRQAIAPSPQPGENAEAGVSEVTDLQARALLKTLEISGKLTPLHLLVAQTLLRAPTISAVNAESMGTAITAGADAMAGVLSSDGATAAQLSGFMASLAKGLSDAAALYRASVDEAVAFDEKVEAYKRGEAHAALLQALISAGSDAGINLETVCTAFAAAGKATETIIESNSGIDLITKGVMRFGFVSGIINLSNYRMLHERVASLSYAGVSPPAFSRIFDVLELVRLYTTNRLKGADGEELEYFLIGDLQKLRVREFNLLAAQDVLLFKMGMESYSDIASSNPEYATIMLAITSRMSAMGGVMAGMTPERLMEILGRSVSPPPLFSPAQLAATESTYIPTLNAYELAAWSYVSKTPAFRYTPVPGLDDQLVDTPASNATFDSLAEPYKSLVLLMGDLGTAGNLYWQDQRDADADLTAHPLNPPRWYPLATVHQILENNRQRLSLIRQHISGVSPQARDALTSLLGAITTF